MKPNTSAYILIDRTLSDLSLRKLETLTKEAINRLFEYKPVQRAHLVRGRKANEVYLNLLSDTGRPLHTFSVKLKKEGTVAEVIKTELRR